MSHIGVNIRRIRQVRQLSQAAFGELFGAARPTVGAWEEGRAEPKTDTLILIAKYFGVSVDMLLTRELSDDDLFQFDLYQKQRAIVPVADEATADQLAHVTPFVRAEQRLEYGMRCQDPHWIDQLPALTFPHTLGGATRAFEIGDSEMAWPALQGGLRPYDVVLTARVRVGDLRVGRVYVLVPRRGPIIRRLDEIQPDEQLRLVADNPDYAAQLFNPAELIEIWEVHRVLTKVAGPFTGVETRLARLEKRLADNEPTIK